MNDIFSSQNIMYRVIQKEMPNTKIAISQKCVKIFAPNVVHFLGQDCA